MAHLHPVYDTDPHFSIDSTTRGITYESTEKLVIVQGDHNSQRYTFELPRYIDGHDMMLCDLVQVHYINIESGSRGRGTGVYKVTDMQLATDDQNTVVLSWLVSQNATKYVGSLNFVLRFACTSGSKIDYAWSTTVYSAVAIITSIDNADLVVEQYADVLEQWYMELTMAGVSSVDTIYAARDAAVEKAKTDINTAKAAAIQAVQETDPDDDFVKRVADRIPVYGEDGEILGYTAEMTELVQATGTATNKAMSQKAVTSLFDYKVTYPTALSIKIEEDPNAMMVYLTFDAFIIRGESVGNAAGLGYSPSIVASHIGKELVTSPSGIENCIEIQDEYCLVFNISTQKFECLHRGSPTVSFLNMANRVLILSQNGGYITEACDGITYDLLRTKYNKTSEDVVRDYEFPSYWDTAVATAVSTVNSKLSVGGNKTFAFGFITDVHYPTGSGYASELMRKMMDECDIPLFIDGGDCTSGAGVISKQGLIEQIVGERKMFSKINDKCLRVIGNHDASYSGSNLQYYGAELTDGEIYHYFFRNNEKKLNIVYGEDGTYFYSDNISQKVRYIMLNSNCYPSETEFTVSKVNGANFGATQLKWLSEVALNVPAGYSIIICSHVMPMSIAELKSVDSTWEENCPNDYMIARSIVSAYVNKTTYTYGGTITIRDKTETYNINANYANAEGDFVCWICGHAHKDLKICLNDVNIIITANDSMHVATDAPTYTPPKTAGTATEDVLDFFCVNRRTRTVDVVRLGAKTAVYGQNRTFTY